MEANAVVAPRRKFDPVAAVAGGVWLAFGCSTLLPVIAAIASPVAWASALIIWVTFCMVYIIGFGFDAYNHGSNRWALGNVIVLIGLAISLWGLIGDVAIITVTYITAAFIFALPQMLVSISVGAFITVATSMFCMVYLPDVGRFTILPLWIAFFSVSLARCAVEFGRERSTA
ncbi:hypothetical protein CMUST_12110 [Corynebacterium mustelae]|uniref:Uncharacterized protein n=1 Tax=Corynebacterium mustelae TaxID=571915 RepID=A0A0G3H4I8_9CORY|nr:hypothetical protein [Corynebacterium mustelae]AKK06733.1 hypothetical protein CMUST_12110 [Corynebacterium mustelae]